MYIYIRYNIIYIYMIIYILYDSVDNFCQAIADSQMQPILALPRLRGIGEYVNLRPGTSEQNLDGNKSIPKDTETVWGLCWHSFGGGWMVWVMVFVLWKHHPMFLLRENVFAPFHDLNTQS